MRDCVVLRMLSTYIRSCPADSHKLEPKTGAPRIEAPRAVSKKLEHGLEMDFARFPNFFDWTA